MRAFLACYKTRLGSFFFFFISILVLFTIVGRRSRADERLYNKLCHTSVVAVLRALRGLDKSPMRQIRYPHVYTILYTSYVYKYKYMYTHAHIYTHPSPDHHDERYHRRGGGGFGGEQDLGDGW